MSHVLMYVHRIDFSMIQYANLTPISGVQLISWKSGNSSRQNHGGYAHAGFCLCLWAELTDLIYSSVAMLVPIESGRGGRRWILITELIAPPRWGRSGPKHPAVTDSREIGDHRRSLDLESRHHSCSWKNMWCILQLKHHFFIYHGIGHLFWSNLQ